MADPVGTAEGEDLISRRRLINFGIGAAGALSCRNLDAQRELERPPNVLLILLDDIGYGDFACLGNPHIKTPNIDGLHGHSLRFTNFHVSPTCSPTRASLMTGRYCNAVGVWHTIMGRSLLSPGQTTLAECFRSSGYTTANYGKWHLGDNYPCRAHDRGFDDAVVCGGGGIWQTPDYFGNDDTDDSYLHNGRFQKYSGFSTDTFFHLAMNFMDAANQKKQPFFCYLATTAAHEPEWAPLEDTAAYRNVPGLDKPGFYGMIANIDRNLGKMLQFLNDRGLRDNTILIFTTDNGTSDGEKVFNASMRGKKGSPYEGGHRVPLFVSWPAGKLEGGRDIPALAAHIDVLPTLADLCQLKNRGELMDGISWRARLYGTDTERQDRTLFVDSQREERLHKWKDTAVLTQHWRLVNAVANGAAPKLELYDIAKDPGQTVDVASQHPEVVKTLSSQYDRWWQRVSAGDDHYVRIVLGSGQENPSTLTSMDWHGDALSVWNQRQIRGAPIANGFWAVEIAHAGQYRFELRRWPRETDLAMSANYTDKQPNQEKAPGIGVAVVKAQLSISGIHKEKDVGVTDRFAAFTISLPKGSAELRTSLLDMRGVERGAYYVYVERL